MPLYRNNIRLWTFAELAIELEIDKATVRRRANRLGVKRYKAITEDSRGQHVYVVSDDGAREIRAANSSLEEVKR